MLIEIFFDFFPHNASVGRAFFLAVVGAAFATVTAEASKDGETHCDWKVHYDVWIPTFDKVPYEHPGFGQHCLDVCCKDPSCKGLTLDSSEKWTCFRYRELPDKHELQSKHPAQLLGNGLWLLHRPQAWSVFVKEVKPGPPLMNMHPYLHNAISWARRGIHHGHEAPHMAVPYTAPEHNDHCAWDVYYNVWEPTFDKGEYRNANRDAGGAHCLEACCKDPSCLGLQLESIELYQCYKYSKAPDVNTKDKKPLDDSRWLVALKPAWSVFLKAGIVPGPSSQPKRSLSREAYLDFRLGRLPGAHHTNLFHRGSQHHRFHHLGPPPPPVYIPASLVGARQHAQTQEAELDKRLHEHVRAEKDHSAQVQPPKLPLPPAVTTAVAPAVVNAVPAAVSGPLTSEAQHEVFRSSWVKPWTVQLLGVVAVIAYFSQRSGIWMLLSVALRRSREGGPKERKASYGSHELVTRGSV